MSVRMVSMWIAMAATLMGAAVAAAAPLETTFMYQGQLKQGGVPAGGDFDMKFTLWDAASSGTKIVDDNPAVRTVHVTNGLFTCPVNFDAGAAWNGEARWVQVEVAPAGSGSYTTLSRQEVTAAPYAAYSLRAPWDGLLSIPVGFADGVDDVGGLTLPYVGSAVAAAAAFSVTNAGTGLAGYFQSSGNTAIQAYTTGAQGQAGYFITNNSSNGWPALSASTNGQAEAGRFETTNASNTAAALYAATNGTGLAGRFVGGAGVKVEGMTETSGFKLSTGAGAGKVLTSDTAGVGTWQPLDATNAWSVIGNAGTDPNAHFVGTTDNQPLELKVNNTRALRIEPTAATPNVIGGGGANNVTTGVWGATIGGGGATVTDYPGHVNSVLGGYGTIGGGQGNTAGAYSSIGGGYGNGAGGQKATVGGGSQNTASGNHSTVPGGEDNSAGGDYSFASGYRAKVRDAATVGDGNGDEGTFVWADSSFSDFTSSGPNQFLVRAAGGVGINTNAPTEALDVFGNIRVSGKISSKKIGSTDDLELYVGASGRAWRAESGTEDWHPPNVIGGGGANNVTTGVCGATIGGGGATVTDYPGHVNSVLGSYGTIGGGQGNTAGAYSSIGGGYGNGAGGQKATVGGGSQNTASGNHSTVPGGEDNSAGGDYSFASGYRAKANHSGAFTWADNNDFDFTSTAVNAFAARCTGGARFVSAIDGSGDPTAGVQLAPGGGSWSSISDRNAKANVKPVDGREVLNRLDAVPVSTWNYKSQDESIRHIGPMAQDFYTSFCVGEEETKITTIDADGVALAAIQGLHQIVKEKDAEIDDLNARVAALEKLVRELAPAETGGGR